MEELDKIGREYKQLQTELNSTKEKQSAVNEIKSHSLALEKSELQASNARLSSLLQIMFAAYIDSRPENNPTAILAMMESILSTVSLDDAHLSSWTSIITDARNRLQKQQQEGQRALTQPPSSPMDVSISSPSRPSPRVRQLQAQLQQRAAGSSSVPSISSPLRRTVLNSSLNSPSRTTTATTTSSPVLARFASTGTHKPMASTTASTTTTTTTSQQPPSMLRKTTNFASSTASFMNKSVANTSAPTTTPEKKRVFGKAFSAPTVSSKSKLRKPNTKGLDELDDKDENINPVEHQQTVPIVSNKPLVGILK